MDIAVGKKQRAVAIWLLIGVAMIIVQVLLGGVTRLTGSGLSITHWEPIKGAVPPLTDDAWNKAFDAYKQLGQYQYLNYDFTLSDFKFIFFWEWFHRLWARLLGVVFAVGFTFFWIKGYFSRRMAVPFIILFLLGGLQGFVGWIMVKSGLNENDLYVNHIRLAAHFIAALGLLCYTLWFALKLLVPEHQRTNRVFERRYALMVLVLLVIQLVYGAFMAGLKAAPAAPTWPSVNGEWLPVSLGNKSWTSYSINVQFLHRTIAYILVALIIHWFWLLRSKLSILTSWQLKALRYPLVLVLSQVILGIVAILLSPKMGTTSFGSYELVAQIHQLVAMFLLMALMINLYLFTGK